MTQYFQCSKHCRNPHPAMPFRMVATCPWILTASNNLWPFNEVFSFGNSQNLQRTSLAQFHYPFSGQIKKILLGSDSIMSRTLLSIWLKFRSSLMKKASYNLANISSNNKRLLFDLIPKNSSSQWPWDLTQQSPLGLVNCMPFGLSYMCETAHSGFL